MKKFITYFVRFVIISERITKKDNSKELYMVSFMVLFIINSAILGTLMFLSVRLIPLEPSYARENLVTPTISFLFIFPVLLLLFYRKRIDVDQIREQVNNYDEKQLKKEKTKGIILTMLCSSSILIALSVLYLLIKFNII
jgi:hypothetical protein